MAETDGPSAGVAGNHIQQFLGLRSKQIVGLFRQSIYQWIADDAQRLGAALAFYAVLSLAPILIVIVGIAALAYGRDAATGQLVWEIQDLVGRDAATAIQAMIHGAYNPSAGAIAALLSIATLMFAASSVAVELRDDLNIIWHTPVATGKMGILRLVKERFYSFLLILTAGFVLLVLLVLSIWVAALDRLVGSHVYIPQFLVALATFLFSFVLITLLFAALYRTLPDVELKWSDVIVGATGTSFIYTVGKQFLSLYLGKTGLTSTYGAAGSLVVILLWVYYCAQLFFLGAEFTKVYTKTFGSHAAAKLAPSDSKHTDSALSLGSQAPLAQ